MYFVSVHSQTCRQPASLKEPKPSLKHIIISRIWSSGMWCHVLSQLGINILEEPTASSFWSKMKATYSSEMLAPTYHLQWNYIPQAHNLDTHHDENPRSHNTQHSIQWIISYMQCFLQILFKVNNAMQPEITESWMYVNMEPKEMKTYITLTCNRKRCQQ